MQMLSLYDQQEHEGAKTASILREQVLLCIGIEIILKLLWSRRWQTSKAGLTSDYTEGLSEVGRTSMMLMRMILLGWAWVALTFE